MHTRGPREAAALAQLAAPSAGEFHITAVSVGASNPDGTFVLVTGFPIENRRTPMGKGILLWVIGIPIPIILLLWIFGFLH
jgi:hypothetical protein